MPDEIESKIRVPCHAPVREKLKRAQAEYVGLVLETNHLFDDAEASLLQSGCGLRVRECRTLDGPDHPATLTYKGPPRPGIYKRRTEIEVRIEDPAAMIDILTQLGFSEHLQFEKKRESWQMRDCRIELDELPEIGCFVEVEGSGEDEIKAALSWLGLTGSDPLRETYAALLSQDRPERPLIIKFPA